MCHKIGVKWRCGHQWAGWLPCFNPSPECNAQRNHLPSNLPRQAIEWIRAKQLHLYLMPLWCCSPQCCQSSLDALAASVTEGDEALVAKYGPNYKKNTTNKEYRTHSYVRKRYALEVDKHVEFCVNCFVGGLGRSPKMCEEMGDQFVVEHPVTVSKDYMLDSDGRIRFDDSDTISELLKFYERTISNPSGIQGATHPSVQHFHAIRDYMLQNPGTCQSGWPLVCKAWSKTPETWRQAMNDVESTAGPSQTLSVSSPASFDTLIRNATPALEHAIASADVLTQEEADQIAECLDRLNEELHGPRALKTYGQTVSAEVLAQYVGEHIGMLLRFETMNLGLLAKHQGSTVSTMALQELLRRLRSANVLLENECQYWNEWSARQPPLVQSQIGITVFENTADLDDRLQRIDSPPDVRETAQQLYQERQGLRRFILEPEPGDLDMDALDEDDGPLGNFDEMDQVLDVWYDPNAGGTLAPRLPGKAYMKIQPKAT